ncbi:MAG: F0F1 ATP synthase subunit epsilon [Clostridia bacterium]|nr:F0F1 ATP synthase subunit epsilon [Clostridia bacterium]
MNSFSLTAATPNGHFFEGRLLALTLRGTEGDLTVLAGHAPLVTVFPAGICKLRLESNEERLLQSSAGLLTAGAQGVTLLSGHMQWQTPDTSPT